MLIASDAAAARIRLQVEPPGGPAFYVYLARPVGLAAGRPIVIAVPDAGAPAKAQLDDWYSLAEAYGFLLAVPELPVSGMANTATLDAIFETVSGRFGMTAKRFSVYGAAAGARYVQRWLLLQPQPKVARVVLAAAGDTLPEFGVPAIEGLAGPSAEQARLRHYLQLPLTVLLGEAQDETGAPPAAVPPDTPVAGADRYAQAQAFLEAGRAAAGLLDVPFGWRLVTVPVAGNDSRDMACAAVPYLLGEL